MNISKIQVCIFDVNGVLIDSNLANARAMAQAFTVDPLLRQRIIQLYLKLTGIDRGSKIRIIQDQVIGAPFKESEFELRWKDFISFGRLAMLDAPLFPGCKKVLAEIGKRRLTRVALSNTPAAELREILAAQHLESLLDVIRGRRRLAEIRISETAPRRISICPESMCLLRRRERRHGGSQTGRSTIRCH